MKTMGVMLKILVVTYICAISNSFVDAVIAINWGRNGIANLDPGVVVDLLLQNGVQEVKLFSSSTYIIKAFKGSGINITVTLANPNAIPTMESAKDWIARTFKPFPNINFRYLTLQNNAFGQARRINTSFMGVVDKMRDLQTWLDESGQSKTKVILTHSAHGVLVPGNLLPSEAEFRPDCKEALIASLEISNRSGTPFFAEFLPFEQVYTSGLDHDFAFSDDKSNLVIVDENGLTYHNVFDLVYDSFIWALRKVGYGDMKIVVSQIGWPTDGYEGANVKSAERFWKALLPRVTSNRGTPLRPGVVIDINIHSLTDESANPAFYMPFSRHWGVYRTNGEPKYKIDLSGHGRDIYPTYGRGINRMPSRWCVFNGNMRKPQIVREQFDHACKNADCTCLSPGGSCGMLSYSENVSYAFNAYFQSTFQDERGCNFEGLGKVVLENPSRDGCVFSVEVIRGTQEPGKRIVIPK